MNNCHKLNQDTILDLVLTGWGRSIYHRHVDDPDFPIDDAPPPPGQVRKTLVLRLPLWEAMAIFGPYIKSSARQPFLEVKVSLPASEREESLRERLHEERQRRVNCAKEAQQHRDALAALAGTVGLAVEYCSPEELRRRVLDHIDQHVPRMPVFDGYWFYGDDVVKVIGAPHSARVKHRNGRETPVCQMDDKWGGPVRRDPRVACNTDDADDEDIPF